MAALAQDTEDIQAATRPEWKRYPASREFLPFSAFRDWRVPPHIREHVEMQLGRGRTLASILGDQELRGITDSFYLIGDLCCEQTVAESVETSMLERSAVDAQADRPQLGNDDHFTATASDLRQVAATDPGPHGPVLICYEGSPAARGAIEQAGQLHGGSAALVLHVWEPVDGATLYRTAVPAVYGQLSDHASEGDHDHDLIAA